MSARDLATELAAEREARELERLRDLRDLILSAYDINGELMGAHRCFFFDEEGFGPIGTFTADFANEITQAALKARGGA